MAPKLQSSPCSFLVLDVSRHNPNHYLHNVSLYVSSVLGLLYRYSYCFTFSEHLCKSYTLETKHVCPLATGNHFSALLPWESWIPLEPTSREGRRVCCVVSAGPHPKSLLQPLWHL